jgi:uncharacterized membrane protein YdfJ with MMPL/SSD domain
MNKRAAIYSLIWTTVIVVVVTGIASITSLFVTQSVAANITLAKTTAQTTSSATSGASLQPALSVQQASDLAVTSAGPGEKLASDPELLIFNGELAYEAKMQDGSLLYLSAQDGSVRYNSITGTDAATASPDQAVSVAETYINNNQPVAIQWARYQNQIVYAVGFSDGALVLVDRSGNVVATQLVQ